MKSEEPIVGKVTTETIPKDKIAEMMAEPTEAREVSGRAIECGLVHCPNCGRTGWVRNREEVRAYECAGCGKIIVS